MTLKEINRRGFVGAAAVGGAAVLSACASGKPAGSADAKKAHFVLVHGAWHGAWCWNKVVPALRAQGHMVTAVDLPGRWMRPEKAASITADAFVKTGGQAIETSPGPVVIVGHSLGGVTVSLAAERYASRVRRSIYLCAFLVPNGQPAGAVAMSDRGSLIPRTVRRDAPTGSSTIIPEMARETFYGDCDEDDIRMALQLLSPEPAAAARVPMKLTAAGFGAVDRVYIECLQDRAISIQTQRAMHTQTPCRRVITLDSSHSPFMSQPAALVNALVSEA